ncbi:MAG: CBS domain-containing protein [Candidatus Competibacteraceae bacterium]|nr:CBS domain-containing protein [Candidatus Competibacteraceae bacterium]MCB1805633.1 CBS domain-containing protein [Candidatus Competibacteraceae bacterium]MCB1812713.1 CBS domain-containing protein [Candidatus Competibacteraceae bacterium]
MLSAISVRDYMAAHLTTFSPEMDILEAIHTLLSNRISGAPVVDKLGTIVGVLSEKDCIAVALQTSYYEERAGKVEEFMTRDVKTVSANASMIEIAKLFLETNFRRYPVVDDDGRLVGQISRRDVLKAMEALW